MPVEKTELLRQAGYGSGDILTLGLLNAGGSRNNTFSRSSYDEAFVAASGAVQTDLMTPDGSVQIRLTARLSPGTDEEMFVRVTNFTDSDPIPATEISATMADGFDSGWQSYTPPTTSSTIRFFTQTKTDPGNNSSILEDAVIAIGVQL